MHDREDMGQKDLIDTIVQSIHRQGGYFPASIANRYKRPTLMYFVSRESLLACRNFPFSRKPFANAFWTASDEDPANPIQSYARSKKLTERLSRAHQTSGKSLSRLQDHLCSWRQVRHVDVTSHLLPEHLPDLLLCVFSCLH